MSLVKSLLTSDRNERVKTNGTSGKAVVKDGEGDENDVEDGEGDEQVIEAVRQLLSSTDFIKMGQSDENNFDLQRMSEKCLPQS